MKTLTISLALAAVAALTSCDRNNAGPGTGAQDQSNEAGKTRGTDIPRSTTGTGGPDNTSGAGTRSGGPGEPPGGTR